jgi:diguanylate cyclase (GGDEF)-like protein/PAS domain S-box-containing protein
MLTTTFGMDRMPPSLPPSGNDLLFDVAFRSAVVGMALVDGDRRMVRVNPAFAALLGYEPAELEGRDFRAITHPEDVAVNMERFAAALRDETGIYRMEKRYLRRDGEIVHAMLSVSAVDGGDDRARMFIAQIEDISARKAAERAAREETERLALAMEVLDGGPWQYDVATGRLLMSPMMTRFICGDGQPLSFEAFKERVHPDDRVGLEQPSLREGEVHRRVICFRVLASDGEYRWIRSTCKLLCDAGGKPETIIGISIDITEERRRQARFQAEAESDPLTGLLNRRGLDRLAASAMRCRGIALIDLDHFKAINDELGHAAGDAVLREAARRIGQAVRRGDAIVRLGGDEFAVLLTDEAPCDCEALAGRLLVALEGNYRAGDEMVLISASIGVALRHDRLEGLESLLSRADQALYQAKRSGRAIWRIAA